MRVYRGGPFVDCAIGFFLTPSLRQVAETAPYMHDGSMATLEQVVRYYNRDSNPNPSLDREIPVLPLCAGRPPECEPPLSPATPADGLSFDDLHVNTF